MSITALRKGHYHYFCALFAGLSKINRIEGLNLRPGPRMVLEVYGACGTMPAGEVQGHAPLVKI